MKVQTKIGNVRVRWQYDDYLIRLVMPKPKEGEDPPEKPEPIEQRYDPRRTSCIITLDEEDVKREDAEIVAQSTIRRHVDDVHDKDLARRYSLQRAIHPSMFCEKDENGVPTVTDPFDKEDRKAIWDAYRNRKPVKEEKEGIPL